MNKVGSRNIFFLATSFTIVGDSSFYLLLKVRFYAVKGMLTYGYDRIRDVCRVSCLREAQKGLDVLVIKASVIG